MGKAIPEFKNENEEHEFWAAHDSSQYVDWALAKRANFPRLKRTIDLISRPQLQKRLRKKYSELPSSADDINQMREERDDELAK